MQKLQQSSNQNLGRGCLLVFAIFWTLISCVIGAMSAGGAILAWSVSERSGFEWFMLFPVIFSLPFIGVGIFLLTVALRPFIAGTRLEKAEITVSTTTPRIGDEVTLTYSQVFKRATEVESIQFKWLLRETARYRRGTNTYTVTHDKVAQEFSYPARRYEASERLNVRRDLVVPDDAMHTFLATNNKLQWFIQATIKMKGWLDYVEEYEMTVMPEVRQ
ncbi:MAG: hypothetical protein HY868_16445 [Chloroflexi bacterium]|nr:hypothetical protein [Chloroflexota bacterium]